MRNRTLAETDLRSPDHVAYAGYGKRTTVTLRTCGRAHYQASAVPAVPGYVPLGPVSEAAGRAEYDRLCAQLRDSGWIPWVDEDAPDQDKNDV